MLLFLAFGAYCFFVMVIIVVLSFCFDLFLRIHSYCIQKEYRFFCVENKHSNKKNKMNT